MGLEKMDLSSRSLLCLPSISQPWFLSLHHGVYLPHGRLLCFNNSQSKSRSIAYFQILIAARHSQGGPPVREPPLHFQSTPDHLKVIIKCRDQSHSRQVIKGDKPQNVYCIHIRVPNSKLLQAVTSSKTWILYFYPRGPNDLDFILLLSFIVRNA